MKKNVCVGLIFGVLACFPFALGNTPAPQSVSDLEGTSWTLNENIVFPDNVLSEGQILYDVAFISDSISFTSISLWYDFSGNGGFQLVYVDSSNVDNVVYNSLDSTPWISDSFRKVSFVGGTELTNSDLIDFMQNNAVLQSSPSSNLDLYDQIYQLLSDFLFGGQVGQDDMTYKALVLTAGSTILSVFMIAIPFMAVFAFMRLFF